MREYRASLIAGLVIGVIAGPALGVVWWRLAPRVPVVVRPNESFPEGFQPSGYIAADVAFAALAVLAGVLVVVGLLAIRRYHLLPALAGSILAGVCGSVLMWQVGTRLGTANLAELAATTNIETVVDAPLTLRLTGLLLLWPITSAVVITVVAAWDWIAHLLGAHADHQRSANVPGQSD